MFVDTISAVCTSPGESAIGIIRISGTNSIDIANKIFASKNKALTLIDNQRKMLYGNIKDLNDNIIDEVLCVYMKAPHSYTAEDVIEIHCHGGKSSIQKILSLTYECSARVAEPGEFTQRAFLNGRIDLAQAEAVMSIIKAKSEVALKQAILQQQGLLSKEVSSIRQELKNIIVDVEAVIDYPEEDLEDVTTEKVVVVLQQVLQRVQNLLGSSDTGIIIKEGLRTAILGKPNVGKSSLLNSLLGSQRAIVTDVAGTTRDSIEEQIIIEGIPVVLIDTAGIRDTSDKVEKIGIEKSYSSLETADLVLFVLDGSREIDDDDKSLLELIVNKNHLILINKADLSNKINFDILKKFGYKDENIVNISTVIKIGWDEFNHKLKQKIYGENANIGEGVYVQEVRHKNLLQQTQSNLVEALNAANAQMPLDCFLIDVKNAFNNMGLITGETVSDEILKEIFARFCLGK